MNIVLISTERSHDTREQRKREIEIKGYLAHKKQRPPRTLQ
jgi:hypothetical protein